MNKTGQGATRLGVIFFAGLLFFAGCKDMLHPGGPEKTGEPEKPNEYTITFDGAGGNPASQTRTVSPGASLGSSNMPSTPTRNGYSFTGWYTAAESGGSEFSAYTTVSGNITVYARWNSGTSTQYTVIFDAAGGSPASQTRTVTDGASLGSSSMPPAPSRSGYTFTGWYTAANSGGSEFTAGTTVTGNITVYARWTLDTSIQYTVIFDADGGSPATQTKTITNGDSVGSSNMPSTPSRGGYTFTGWYTVANSGGSEFTAGTTITGDITVYARWTLAEMPDNLSLNDALTWINNNAVTGNIYTITLRNNETIAPRTLSYSEKTVGITLNSGITERTVSLNAVGSLFTMGSGVTLTLGNNVTLQGRSDNTAPLVTVNNGGTLVMNTGSKVSGNTYSSSYSGGGVYVNYGGIFTMNGGTISGNTAIWGGGVCIYSGTFTMNGGTISGNTASYGGGVRKDSGVFTMNGGTISGNTASYGGGVFVSTSGTFTKQSGGVIYGSNESSITLRNTATSGNDYGHAVYVNIDDFSGKKRNTTAGTGVALDSGINGSAGGWE